MKNVLGFEDFVNESKFFIMTLNGRRLVINKDDLKRLKSGKDVVGKSLIYPGQEEWILHKDNWKIEESLNEGVWTKIMAGVKRGDNGPWSIVATDYRKVVGQDIDIKFRELIPIHYKDMKEKYPNARLHIEDGGGGVVWSE
jgi:hypothetical protein